MVKRRFAIRLNYKNPKKRYTKIEPAELVYFGSKIKDKWIDCIPSEDYYVETIEETLQYMHDNEEQHIMTVGMAAIELLIEGQQLYIEFCERRLAFCSNNKLNWPSGDYY